MFRSLSQLDDSRLAARVRAGDEAAFEVLYDRHARSLLSFCRHMLGSTEDAEDALQQTMVRAHRALVGAGPLPETVRPWLYAIARNRCKTLLATRREACVPVDEVEVSFDGLADDVRRRADLQELVGDLAKLPEDQRGALVLFELGGMSQAEIALAIGVPAAKVKALVYQARTELMAERDARAVSCVAIREQLAVARGGALRRGPLKRHLRQCDGCREYGAAVASQRAGLAAILPVAPALSLKATVLGAVAGEAAGGAAAAGAGAGAGGGAVAAAMAKVAVTAVVLGGGAAGGAVAVHRVSKPAGVRVAATVTVTPTPSPVVAAPPTQLPVRPVASRRPDLKSPVIVAKSKPSAPKQRTASATATATATPRASAVAPPPAAHESAAKQVVHSGRAPADDEFVVEVGKTKTVKPRHRVVVITGVSPATTPAPAAPRTHRRPRVRPRPRVQTVTSPAATPRPRPRVRPRPRPVPPPAATTAPTPEPTPVATPVATPEATPPPPEPTATPTP